MDTDRIEKRVLLQASQARVWEAISNAGQFGAWFGVAFDGPFAAGARLIGRIKPTQVDPEVAKLQALYEGVSFEMVVDSIEPMQRFAFRWHPYAVEPGVDYAKEPMTLVEILLEAVSGGTLLTIIESGFDRIPLARRAKAFAANDGGWAKQTTLIEKYLRLHGVAPADGSARSPV
jgi:uncharacterized protein YndB with AHSA1/START domain